MRILGVQQRNRPPSIDEPPIDDMMSHHFRRLIGKTESAPKAFFVSD